jgi:hypothetical protein
MAKKKRKYICLQKLEMKIEEIKRKLQVMKHPGDEDDTRFQKKKEEMNDILRSMI